MLSRKDIEEQREQLQEDIRCITEGFDDLLVDNACQAVVDRMNILIAKL